MVTRQTLAARMSGADDLLAVDGSCRALLESQCGVATRQQLLAYGITAARIAANIAALRWRAVGRHVVVLSNAPLTDAQRSWVAVLLLEKPCALAGASASSAAGLVGFEPERVHILVAHGTHVALPTWVKVHESRRFSVADVNPVALPPRTRTPRSLIDAAAWSSNPRRACAILCGGVQQRIVTTQALAIALPAAGRVRHARIMREILGDISGGGHTLAEIDFGALAERAGFAPPRRQVLRREPSGRVRYLDVELDLPDRTRVVVEIDGAAHQQVLQGSDDMTRQNEIVIHGVPVLRYSSLTVRLDGARVVEQLARMRARHLGPAISPPQPWLRHA